MPPPESFAADEARAGRGVPGGSVERDEPVMDDVRFDSFGERCAAWHLVGAGDALQRHLVRAGDALQRDGRPPAW